MPDNSAEQSRKRSAFRDRKASERELIARLPSLEAGSQACSQPGQLSTAQQPLQPFEIQCH
jgi:hypothetical protein